MAKILIYMETHCSKDSHHMGLMSFFFKTSWEAQSRAHYNVQESNTWYCIILELENMRKLHNVHCKEKLLNCLKGSPAPHPLLRNTQWWVSLKVTNHVTAHTLSYLIHPPCFKYTAGWQWPGNLKYWRDSKMWKCITGLTPALPAQINSF